MNDTATYTAHCFCGAVELELDGAPEAMGYCHCESCRHWSAGPVNAFSLWPKSAVRVVKGAEKLGGYAKSPTSMRRWCTTCGGHVMTEHPHWGLIDVYAAVIEGLDFVPGVHVNYQEAVLPIADNVHRLKDFPEALGGSGEAM